MNLLLYLPNQSSFLVERWLRIRTDVGTVQLLVSKSSLSLASELKSRYPAVSEILILPESEDLEGKQAVSLREQIRGSGVTKVVLPLSVDTATLRFVEATNIPDLRPFYSAFRQLWLLGFREFEIFNLNGTQTFFIPRLLDEFVDLHKGKRCFVAGNGPSLNKIDMTRLENEITLGANRCYLGYEKWGFSFTYWGIMDRLQIEEYSKEYEDHIPPETIKFFPFEYLPFLRFYNACPLNHFYDVPDFPQFSDSCDKIYLGNTVTYMLIQIAAVMGCNPIILIGVDHRFCFKDEELGKLPNVSEPSVTRNESTVIRWLKNRLRGTMVYEVLKCWRQVRARSKPTRSSTDTKEFDFWTASDATVATHFDPRYTSGEKRFVPPRSKRAEKAFECAARWAEANGVQIVNATPGTALTAFPLVSYDSLF